MSSAGQSKGGRGGVGAPTYSNAEVGSSTVQSKGGRGGVSSAVQSKSGRGGVSSAVQSKGGRGGVSQRSPVQGWQRWGVTPAQRCPAQSSPRVAEGCPAQSSPRVAEVGWSSPRVAEVGCPAQSTLRVAEVGWGHQPIPFLHLRGPVQHNTGRSEALAMNCCVRKIAHDGPCCCNLSKDCQRAAYMGRGLRASCCALIAC